MPQESQSNRNEESTEAAGRADDSGKNADLTAEAQWHQLEDGSVVLLWRVKRDSWLLLDVGSQILARRAKHKPAHRGTGELKRVS